MAGVISRSLTGQQEGRGRPQIWAFSPRRRTGSSWPSSPAGPRTSRCPTGGRYSGSQSGRPSQWPGSQQLQNTRRICEVQDTARYLRPVLTSVYLVKWTFFHSIHHQCLTRVCFSVRVMGFPIPDATSRGPCAFRRSFTASWNSRPPAFSRAVPSDRKRVSATKLTFFCQG